MKKIILITLVFSLTTNLFADEAINLGLINDSVYQNIREARSELISSSKEDEIENLYKNTKEMEVLKKIISDPSVNRCATKVISKIKQNLDLYNEKDIKLAILALRLDDSIDDISTNILMNANDLSALTANPIAKNSLTADEEEKGLEIYKTKMKDIRNKSLCIEDTYRELVSSLIANGPKFYKNLKRMNKLAFRNDYLLEKDYKIFEVFRIKKVHEWPLTLSSYAQSLEQINKRFSERKKESASFVTNVKFRQKKSMRQSLYEKFDSTQIILLANMVRDLKTRLDSKEVTINIDYEDKPGEIIKLSPMEKFRFILKLLRKEMANINNSSLLGGKSANYFDLITASYEVGYISAGEIEQLAALQEIWSPSKTTKEKVMFWIDHFGGVASVLIPPPFGFISVMVIMLIDQQLKDAPINRDPDFNIF